MKKLLLLTLLLSASVYAAFTPFPPSSPAPNAIATKGGLLTSDGAALVEAIACADTEIIEFDSADSKGFKCVAKPTAITHLRKGIRFNDSGLTDNVWDATVVYSSSSLVVTPVVSLGTNPAEYNNHPLVVSFGNAYMENVSTGMAANTTPFQNCAQVVRFVGASMGTRVLKVEHNIKVTTGPSGEVQVYTPLTSVATTINVIEPLTITLGVQSLQQGGGTSRCTIDAETVFDVLWMEATQQGL